MDILVNEKRDNGKASEMGQVEIYKQSIKKGLYSHIANDFEEETRRIKQEMVEVRENAIKLIAEEQKKAIAQIVEEEKKTIWMKVLETRESEVFNSELIKEGISQSSLPEKSAISGTNGDSLSPANNHKDNVFEKVDLEILPPRDQNEIATINTFLINMNEVMNVELVTLVDKSLFKVKLNKPVDFIERLGHLPEILNAEEVREAGQKKIKIALLAKSKLEKNQSEMNEKVNKIFNKKK
jgi:hypothetical protein